AHRLDFKGRRLLLVLVVDPDAVDLDAVAALHLPLGVAGHLRLVFEVVHGDRVIDARLVLLRLRKFSRVQSLACGIERAFLTILRSPKILKTCTINCLAVPSLETAPQGIAGWPLTFALFRFLVPTELCIAGTFGATLCRIFQSPLGDLTCYPA